MISLTYSWGTAWWVYNYRTKWYPSHIAGGTAWWVYSYRTKWYPSHIAGGTAWWVYSYRTKWYPSHIAGEQLDEFIVIVLRLHVLCLASNAARVSELFILDCLLCFSNIYLSVGLAADPQLLKVFFVNIRATRDVNYPYDLYISLFYHLCYL